LNQSVPAFSDKSLLKFDGMSFTSYNLIHIKNQGILAILISEDGKTLTGVYKDSNDQSFSFTMNITLANDVLKSRVKYI
jgi:hypothetical protein